MDPRPETDHSSPIRVALIEDNRFIRAGWEAALSASPEFDVVGAYRSCEEAFLDPALESCDVVLMDIGLPGISGIEGVLQLKSRAHSPEVVMCTVYDDDQKVFDAICAGAVGYLLKKTPPEGLKRALSDAVSGGSPMTPNIARKIVASFQKRPLGRAGEDDLTPRERDVLGQMAEGKSYAAIAKQLFISVDGVRYHIRHIYEKLQVHSRGEAIAAGLKRRLIPPLR
jgi:DNA-binding NarL/FixJ family response regulator